MKKHKKLIITFGSIILSILIIILIFGIYFGNYYHGVLVDDYLVSNENVMVDENDYLSFIPKDEIKGGIILYPGAKVEYSAYSELMYKLALEGYASFIVEMPLNFAIFGINKADEIIEDYKSIDKWYLMGHSLGGAIVSSYANKHIDDIEGVILLAAYSTSDLSETKVLSIYGSNDLVLSKDKYEENKINLGSNFVESIIDGGNHANFGSYGVQSGDGEATIEQDLQIDLTIQSILDFIS